MFLVIKSNVKKDENVNRALLKNNQCTSQIIL
jgi:hypothetical protein